LNLLLFDLFFGGGVSMPPVVVLMLFGSHTVFRFHACFCFTHVLFLGFWFTHVSVFLQVGVVISWVPATDLVMLLVHASWW
jgi:hypothetical protein